MAEYSPPESSSSGTVRTVWRSLVGIDVRSLAALRISLALIVIYDVLARARDLEAHYSDTGLLPRADLLKWKEDAYNFSIHMLSGVWWVQGLLFLVTLWAAGALLLGRRTRLASFVCWYSKAMGFTWWYVQT